MISSLIDDDTADIVRVALSGELTGNDIRNAVKTITTTPQFRADANVIWNLREIKFSISIYRLSRIWLPSGMSLQN